MQRNDAALMYAKTKAFSWRLANARRIVADALAIPDAVPYISLSGGKDSTVVHDLVYQKAGNLPAIWSDDEWWLPETLEYIQRLKEKCFDVRQIRTNARHAEWFSVDGDYDGIPDYAHRQGFNLCFLGLRQEESNVRRMHLRHMGALFLCQADKSWHCNPIHDWTWRDVWAYIVSNRLDYNRAYDRMEEIGVEPERQRIGPLAVDRVLGYGQMVILKKGWPELFNRFAQAHPEARNYV